MPNLLSLPGELRNEIYIACFDITFDRSEPQPADIHSRHPIPDIAIKTAFRALPPSVTDHGRGPDDNAMMPTFTYPPRLLPLLQLNRQIHREASSLFYQTYLPLYRPTFHSFSALRTFTANLPDTHARHLRGTLQMTKVNLGPELRAVGLVEPDGAPHVRWRRGPSTSRVTTMRTDCFLAVRYRPLDLQYDQLSMYGHLGRIRWRGEKMVLRRPDEDAGEEHGVRDAGASEDVHDRPSKRLKVDEEGFDGERQEVQEQDGTQERPFVVPD